MWVTRRSSIHTASMVPMHSPFSSKVALCAVVIVTPLLASCLASTSAVGASEKTETFALSIDETWSRVEQWFADHDIPVKDVDKASGTMSTKHKLSESHFGYCDCGTSTATNQIYERNGKYTVRIISEGEVTRVTVTVQFSARKDVRFSSTDSPSSVTISCPSTGELETALLAFVASGSS